jgi:hypothetical protein
MMTDGSEATGPTFPISRVAGGGLLKKGEMQGASGANAVALGSYAAHVSDRATQQIALFQQSAGV